MRSLLILALLVLSANVMAKDGSSGCGPGWYVLKENSLVSSSLRATTNGMLAPTTTIGMTLGTSNCSQHKIVLNEKKSLHFVTHNLPELKNEVAKGNGDYINAFNETLGCDKKAAQKLKIKLKGQYQDIFKTENAQDVLGNIYKTIFSDKDLAQACLVS